MSFLRPELLLLALPIGWVLWRTTPVRSWRFVLRAAGALALLAALAGPLGGGASTGRDLVLVVDRSRSMPGGVGVQTTELMELIGADARAGDRLAVLSFGEDVVVDQALAPPEPFMGFTSAVDADGSRLADALDRALSLIPENRQGGVLLLSDGEAHGTAHGATPEDAARRAALRGVRVDVRAAEDRGGADVSVDSLDLPESVGLGERFQFGAWVRSDRVVDVGWRLLRGEEVIASGTKELRRGLNQMVFRDIARSVGTARYRLALDAPADTIPENDAGLGVTRVEGRRPLLLVNEDGASGRLAAALRGAGLTVDVRSPEQLPQGDGVWLDAYSGVVLENVGTSRLGRMVPDLARQVADLGTGLLVTGGRASFGVGGYYKSALDPVLPVTMEMRIEHRKMALAMAVVLDRSGSMAAQAERGLTKMDLANAGAIAAMRLLGTLDELAVIAVDSSPHTVVARQPVDDPEALAYRVSGIESGGGGIYTYTGLLAAAHELEDAEARNRHIILFADAADAEEPGDYKELLRQLTEERNTTVSVVALGTSGDSDAAFLEDVAARGGGQAYFTTSPTELPRLFAQDTLLAARSSFVEVPTASEVRAAMLALSPDARPGPWVTLPGYNLCYARPGASVGVISTDEFGAPLVATMQAGLGRSAAFTGQVDGRYGVADGDWPQVAHTLVTLVRWISGQEASAAYFAGARRDGREAVVSVDVDRTAGGQDGTEPLQARLLRPDGSSELVSLAPVGGDRYEARVPLGGMGVYRIAAETESGDVLAFPPLAVSYSPEYEARADPDEGRQLLGRLARIGRGRMNPPVNEILRGDRTGRGTRDLAHLFAAAGLLLLLAEITWRRWYERAVVRVARKAEAAMASVSPVVAGAKPMRGAKKVSTSAVAAAGGEDVAPEPVAPQAKPTLDDTLASIKKRSKRR